MLGAYVSNRLKLMNWNQYGNKNVRLLLINVKGDNMELKNKLIMVVFFVVILSFCPSTSLGAA